MFLKLLLSAAKRKATPASTASVRDGSSLHPWWVLEFLLIPSNLIGETAVLFCICISLITRMSSIYFICLWVICIFFFWELSKWILKPPKHHCSTESSAASGLGCCGLRAPSMRLWSVRVAQPPLCPSHPPCFDYFLSSPSRHSPHLSGALVSLQAFYCAGL